MNAKHAYLKVTLGAQPGACFDLDPYGDNSLGRGFECNVKLEDKKCSRVHAKIMLQDDGWIIVDCQSRNGLFVDNQRTETCDLQFGQLIRIGDTSFEFCKKTENQEREPQYNENPTTEKTVVFEEQVRPADTGDIALAILKQQESTEAICFVFQCSLRLLSIEDPDQVVLTSLQNLKERTNASVAGFMWLRENGNLTPTVVLPESAAKEIELSDSLTKIVTKKQRAVRMDHRHKDLGEPQSNQHDFADSICVPLVYHEKTLGVIHLYLKEGRFKDSDYLVARASSEITVRSLVRARQHISLVHEHERLQQKAADSDEMMGQSAPMIELKKKIARIANASGCVLVRGESGAGKELVSRALHKNSPRSDRPMLSVNCAAIPADLVESQLFGHKKGAFTSADSDHIGWFQQSDTGTLFLDEVGELPLEGQAKLLRILEGHPFLPVGGTKEITVDVRVICATNRDLSEIVAEKRFREDLYYRLSVFEVSIPPLRERGSDIELLVDFFLEHFNHQHGRPGLGLSEKSRELLLGYSWPGNVRQLRNVIDSAVVMAEGNQIKPTDLGLRDVGSTQLESLRLDFWERKLIKEALSRTNNSVPNAAKLLGIGRATVYRKI
ncbi:MAG: sigma 54-interacting transcriptional regulator, partial [Planctomycetota bacterium]|nr:sigma 54-interacting transcriptional regulator [Planctomycetota bacterium]